MGQRDEGGVSRRRGIGLAGPLVGPAPRPDAVVVPRPGEVEGDVGERR